MTRVLIILLAILSFGYFLFLKQERKWKAETALAEALCQSEGVERATASKVSPSSMHLSHITPLGTGEPLDVVQAVEAFLAKRPEERQVLREISSQSEARQSKFTQAVVRRALKKCPQIIKSVERGLGAVKTTLTYFQSLSE